MKLSLGRHEAPRRAWNGSGESAPISSLKKRVSIGPPSIVPAAVPLTVARPPSTAPGGWTIRPSEKVWSSCQSAPIRNTSSSAPRSTCANLVTSDRAPSVTISSSSWRKLRTARKALPPLPR